MYEWLWIYLILFSLIRITFPVSYTLLYINKISTIEIEIITKLLSEGESLVYTIYTILVFCFQLLILFKLDKQLSNFFENVFLGVMEKK